MNRNTGYWLCQIGGWGAYFLVTIPLAMTQEDYDARMILISIPMILSAIGITHLYRRQIKRRGWIDLPPKQLIPRAFVAVLIMAILCAAIAGLLQYLSIVLLGKEPMKWQLYILSLAGWAMLLLAWSLAYYGIHFFWNYRDAEVANWKLKADFREAELRALQAQVNPHFFFNMLNNLRGLIAEDPDKAQEVVTRMAKLLRASFQADKEMLVPLEAELAIAENYLKLEAVRLEERLRYQLKAPPESLTVPVPAMLVQTLVENSIKHGISRLPEGGEVLIEAELEPDALRLTVRNTGRLRKPDEDNDRANGHEVTEAMLSPDNGIGLKNARERLRLHYGPGARLDLAEQAANQVLASVTIPLEVSGENADRG